MASPPALNYDCDVFFLLFFFSPRFPSPDTGAMENWGVLIFRDDVLLVDDMTSTSGRLEVALTVVHEISRTCICIIMPVFLILPI